MRLLLDSNVLIRLAAGTLGDRAMEAIERAAEATISAATIWEIGIKRALGRLRAPADLHGALFERGFAPLSITIEHAAAAAELPRLHGDPFDRMLVAQAQIERLVLMTGDRRLGDYEIPILEA